MKQKSLIRGINWTRNFGVRARTPILCAHIVTKSAQRQKDCVLERTDSKTVPFRLKGDGLGRSLLEPIATTMFRSVTILIHKKIAESLKLDESQLELWTSVKAETRQNTSKYLQVSLTVDCFGSRKTNSTKKTQGRKICTETKELRAWTNSYQTAFRNRPFSTKRGRFRKVIVGTNSYHDVPRSHPFNTQESCRKLEIGRMSAWVVNKC